MRAQVSEWESARARNHTVLSVDRMVERTNKRTVGSKWQAREFYNTYSQHVTSYMAIHTYAICAHCSTCNSKFNFIAFVSFHLISISYSSYSFTRLHCVSVFPNPTILLLSTSLISLSRCHFLCRALYFYICVSMWATRIYSCMFSCDLWLRLRLPFNDCDIAIANKISWNLLNQRAHERQWEMQKRTLS